MATPFGVVTHGLGKGALVVLNKIVSWRCFKAFPTRTKFHFISKLVPVARLVSSFPVSTGSGRTVILCHCYFLKCSGTCSGWGILIFYDSSVVIISLVFHSSFMQCYPLGSSYLVERVLSISL